MSILEIHQDLLLPNLLIDVIELFVELFTLIMEVPQKDQLVLVRLKQSKIFQKLLPDNVLSLTAQMV